MFSSISPEKAREGLEAVDYIFGYLGEMVVAGTDMVLKAEGAEEAEEIKQLADILRFYNGIEVQLEGELASVLTTKVVGNEIIVSKGLDRVAKLPRNIDAYTKEIDRIVLKMGKDLGSSSATKEMIDAIEVSFGKAFSAGVAQGVEIGIAEEFIDDAAELKRRLGRRPVTAALEKQLEYVYAVQGHYLDEMEPKLRRAVAKELEKVSERWRKSAADRIRVINEDTVRSIQDKLVFAELNGQSLPQTTKGIMEDLVEDAATKKKIPRYAKSMRGRADAIAKTELHRARQSAVISLGKAEGKKLWTWISMYDGRVCTICAPRHNKTKFIENWEDIPPSHPRCRCVLIPGRSDPHFGAKGRPGDDGISLISRAVPVKPVNLRPPARLVAPPPPTVFSVENINASPGHVKKVEELINNLDEDIRTKLKEAGIKFRTGRTMLDLNPTAPVSELDYANGMFNPDTNAILMPEKIIRAGKVVKSVGSKEMSAVLRHEVGHAFDIKILGAPSQAGDFVKHYATDYKATKALGISDQVRIEYYVQTPIRIGRQETFAEIFADLTGGGQATRALLKRAFPNVYKYMSELVKGF